ncbi:hypothetical protein Air01nite_27870 [Asanoa iriomotensis]|uniref:Uncharacterized protein n=1 Tax=Asanoa iriomotensis TaxID=234613 RepID=A0ABQ4C1N3_9ACTN|nr:hypothetical protein [Asanoa iriomotensis]GIF56692.1 hypothetical protein Air01nite_27870 [Asanoa iriomotensis]
MTAKQRWVIIAVCGGAAAVLAAVALIVGLQGIEVLSWLAGIASLIAALLGPVLARRSPSTDKAEPPQRDAPRSTNQPASHSSTPTEAVSAAPASADTASAPDRGPIDVRHAQGVQINLGNGGNTQHLFGERRPSR